MVRTMSQYLRSSLTIIPDQLEQFLRPSMVTANVNYDQIHTIVHYSIPYMLHNITTHICVHYTPHNRQQIFRLF